MEGELKGRPVMMVQGQITCSAKRGRAKRVWHCQIGHKDGLWGARKAQERCFTRAPQVSGSADA